MKHLTMTPFMWNKGPMMRADDSITAYAITTQEGVDCATIIQSRGKVGWEILRHGLPNSKQYESPDEALAKLEKSL